MALNIMKVMNTSFAIADSNEEDLGNEKNQIYLKKIMNILIYRKNSIDWLSKYQGFHLRQPVNRKYNH